jgi:trk system potassium uptake protein TrkH
VGQRLRYRPLVPSLLVALFFLAAILAGWGLLSLPMAQRGAGSPIPMVDTLFTATSAVTVTGLATVDTGTAWTAFGQAVILALIQLGGLGMATSGTLLLLVMSRRLGLSTRLLAQAETPGLSLGDVRRVAWFVVRFTVVAEAALTLVLAAVFHYRYDYGPAKSAWYGLFHTVSAFNNAGFALFSDNLISFRSDPFVLVPIMVAIVVGGLGFIVFRDILERRTDIYGRKRWKRPAQWSLHSRLTVAGTVVLLAVGAVLMTIYEFHNPATMAGRPAGDQLLSGVFASVTSRTAGFNIIDYGVAREETLLTTSLLMIIGGGSASTAGGLKVSTVLVLLLVIRAEARGDRDVQAFGRRVNHKTIRTAISVAAMYFFLVGAGVLLLVSLSPVTLRDGLFETVSAIATVGLSTGITPNLPVPALVVLIFLMFVGRIGAMTLASAFALRRPADTQHFRYPEGTPIIG